MGPGFSPKTKAGKDWWHGQQSSSQNNSMNNLKNTDTVTFLNNLRLPRTPWGGAGGTNSSSIYCCGGCCRVGGTPKSATRNSEAHQTISSNISANRSWQSIYNETASFK